VASNKDALGQQPVAHGHLPDATVSKGRTWPWHHGISLRLRLLLLVCASILPLIGLAVVREYLDYATEQQGIYQQLLTVSRGMGVTVERELMLRQSALETLAMSRSLQFDDLGIFDARADGFLARQPKGSVLGLVGPDGQFLRIYGPAPGTDPGLSHGRDDPGPRGVFKTGRPVVSDLQPGRISATPGISVDVPVFTDGRVIYDLFLWLPPAVISDLILRQHLPPRTVLTVVDTTGTVVARIPNGDRYLGSRIVPGLLEDVQTRSEGVMQAPTLEGIPAVAAFTHVAPYGWAVVVGAPEEVLFAPMRAAMVHVAAVGAGVLGLGLLLAILAARQITGPIAKLSQLARNEDAHHRLAAAATGLPETDTVAQALVMAAAERRQVAGQLAASELRFRALFKRSPSGTILLDPDTMRVMDCNDVAASFVGCSVDEFTGRLITDFVLQTSPARAREISAAVVAGAPARYETRIKGVDGPRDVLIAAAPVQVSGRTLVLLNQIDVTDLRRAEADVRINQERFELARQGANLGIWDWDLRNDTLTWSEQQWHLHGLEPRPGGPERRLWQQAVHPSDLQRVQQELVAVLKRPDHPYATEYSVVMPDGSVRRLLGRGQTIRGTDGRAVRMVGVNMDVTARYAAEMARDRLIGMLEAEHSRLAEIIDALPVGVGIVDANERVVLGNTMMKRLNGPINQPLGAAPRGEWITHAAGGERVLPEDFPIQRALRLGETALPGMDYLFRHEDGLETWFRVGSIPLRSENGQVQEALAIFQDIDAEKRLLEFQQQINVELEQRVREEMAAREAAQQRAAHAERMQALGQIAGGIAHDFNNVLQAVLGGAALIDLRPGEIDRVLRNARMIRDAARRGAAITSRLLAFSRRGDLHAEHVDPVALLTDMAEVLTHTLGGAVVCRVQTPPDLPPLLADRGQLETVLVNLATNARDAMPSGGTLTLAAGTEVVAAGLPNPAGLTPGNYVRIAVSDTGTGMDRAVLARVTEPFFTTKKPGQGTGLGLAMAKGFVEQSGGGLSIDSRLGEGTCVFLWLPSATMSVGMAQEPSVVGDAATDQARVLLVDDDAIVREVLTLSLEDAGYSVLPADSGAAALTLLASRDPVDIIVSDLTMPGMDGLTLIRTAQERQANLPAVLLTGYAGDGAALAVGGAIHGTFSLLRKPVTRTELVERVSALLASSKAKTTGLVDAAPAPIL
jgi:PAS domain S-box-containing protein